MTIADTSRLLQRQPQQPWRDQSTLVVNPADADLATTDNSAWLLHAGLQTSWANGVCCARLSEHWQRLPCKQVLLYVPKEKALLAYLLRQLAMLAEEPTRIWLVGEKRSGIQRLLKQPPTILSDLQKTAVGNHCVLTSASLQPSRYPLEQDWLTLTYDGIEPALMLRSLPGVFSQTGVDAATRLLLQQLPPLQGSVLDFACGTGIIGCFAQRQTAVTQVSFLDVSPLAIAAARCNASDTGNSKFYLSDGLREVAHTERFNVIVSNPPFHRGLATDYSIAEQFISESHQHLHRGGQLFIVANRFLPWPKHIEQHFGHCETLAADSRFAVYRGIRR